MSPADGITVGPRPLFRFVFKGDRERDARTVIEISRDRWKTVERSWDARVSAKGWDLQTDPEGGRFRSPEPLPEGAWEWRVRFVQGSALVEGGKAASFKVDATPPAEIEDLRLQRKGDESVALSWDPVLNDVDGRPEIVDYYVVYRYDSRGIFTQAAPARIGKTRSLSFIDRPAPMPAAGSRGERSRSGAGSGVATEPDAGKTRSTRRSLGGWKPIGDPRALYYKVVAVDVAGNELGLREPLPEADGPQASSDPDR